MNDALKGFLLGFGIGAATTVVLGLPFVGLLAFFGINPAEVILILAVVGGLISGIVGVILALLFGAIQPYMRLIISVGLLALGLFLAQPGLDAAGAIGLALTFTVGSGDDIVDESG